MTKLAEAYYANARKEIASLLPQQMDTVLEIGCSEGNTLAWLRDEKGAKSCRGMEILSDVAERAKLKGLEIAVGNVENDGIPFSEKNDLVLCLDVLEHLNDPWNTLAIIVESIRPGGSLIVSLPNIAHISILSGLIFRNDWHYENSGILDRTHLRFFTHRTACELLTKSGLQLVTSKPKFGRKTHRNLNFITLGLFERFFAFQYIFLATKKV
jgi:2-polyprenyl-3-methyl-5-hydroxy-6-metoxy-1,4-benzoquinol methylase